ncbi:MAG: class I SAM-dependent methyltransferase [Candidatus Falkowbacteria bacterium]|nr:class I SAM-dependent methyltransferase [Candidatus Falkowbacteria bacterium]
MINLMYDKFSPDSKILDLGCGQGKDLLFLAQNGFSILGIDKSDEALDHVKNKIEELKFFKARVEKINIRDYVIEQDEFDVIICQNVLNFFNKDEAINLIKDIKTKLKVGGYILLQVFTTDDPSFKNEKKFACYFEPKELSRMFNGFDIIFCFEGTLDDKAHKGFEMPHQHGLAKIVVQKI